MTQVFVRRAFAERPLRPAHIRAGRSLLRTAAGLGLVTGVGLVAFIAGYPSGNGAAPSARAPDMAGTTQAPVAFDRTRPEALAKLASAPAASIAQDPSATGLESDALAARIEAAASVTGSISNPKKPVRVVPVPRHAAVPPKAAPIPARRDDTLSSSKPQARRVEPATRKPVAPERAAQPAPTTLASFFGRSGMSKPAPPPDLAR